MSKILVIDDDAAVRRTIARVLVREGYEVLSAEDGRRGLALFRSEDPDLVLTDIIMPDQEGIETIIAMGKLRPDVKIIAMSGGGRIANVDLLTMAQKFGAAETIRKPFDPATLRDCVARCLRTLPAVRRYPPLPDAVVRGSIATDGEHR